MPRIGSFIVIALLLMNGCHEAPTELQSVTEHRLPAADPPTVEPDETLDGSEPTQPGLSANHAIANGSEVIREPVPQSFALIDFERNLSGLAGVQPADAADVCSDPGFAPYDIGQVLAVIKPTGDVKVVIKDDEQLFVVYQGVPGPGDRVSCTFQNQAPLATGTLRSTYSDNDLFTGPGPGAGAFQYRATGVLTNPATGQRYHALIKFGGSVAPGSDVIVWDEDVILLTPIGGQ